MNKIIFDGSCSQFIRSLCQSLDKDFTKLTNEELREYTSLYRRFTVPAKKQGKTRALNSKYLRADKSERESIKAGRSKSLGRVKMSEPKQTSKASKLFGKDK